MKGTKKAVLLSALLFPGAGHYFLKQYLQAILLSAVACCGLYFLIVETVVRLQRIAEQILAGEIAYDIAKIAKLASTNSAGSDGQLLNAATTAVALAWLIGIVDAFRVGRRLDSQTTGEAPSVGE